MTKRKKTEEPYEWVADLVRILDGDTLELNLWRSVEFEVDQGFEIKSMVRHLTTSVQVVRLHGIDTPEKTNKEASDKAIQFIKDQLDNGPLIVKTYKPDKYGRYLAVVNLPTPDEGGPLTLNEALIKAGHAVPYFGGKKGTK